MSHDVLGPHDVPGTFQSESASACPVPTTHCLPTTCHCPTCHPSSCKRLHTATIPPTPGHHQHHPWPAMHACVREDAWIGERTDLRILPHAHMPRKVVSVR